MRTPAQRKRVGERRFRPIAIEIGWVAYEWNRLHAELAELFAVIVSEKRMNMPLAIWHSVPSDRTQRDMLRAALEVAYSTTSLNKAVYSGARAVLDDLNSLAGRRNIALHAPLIFVIDTVSSDIEIWPQAFLGNPHARELANKELIGEKLASEFKWHRANLARLADYVGSLRMAAIHPDWTLREKPPLLPREQVGRRGQRSRKKSPK
jgi:hypothetical protein